MQKTQSITENKDFKRLYYRGQSVSSPFIVLYYMRNKALKGTNNLGLTVSTKIGKAVVRNRVRRRISEAYRSYEPKIKSGYNIVIVARQASKDATFWQIHKSLGGMLKRAELFL